MKLINIITIACTLLFLSYTVHTFGTVHTQQRLPSIVIILVNVFGLVRK